MAVLNVMLVTRGHRTICLPITEDVYARTVGDPAAFRRLLLDSFQAMPEVFPTPFAQGFRFKDERLSAKRNIGLRRIVLRDKISDTVRPSFFMPYLVARTGEVQGPLFLRKCAVPFWALAQVFGRNAMCWYRIEMSLGRFSVVGTTVRRGPLPEHVLADEHHQTCDGQKRYLATTNGSGCVLGVEPAVTAGTDELRGASAVFRSEARDVVAGYAPKTVNTDGWKGTKCSVSESAIMPEGTHVEK